MEIEVGEYIRTKQGYIAKVMSVDTYVELDTLINFKKISGNHYAGQRLFDEDDLEITKHSNDIIDLIEIGDIVNGRTVIALNTQYKVCTAWCEDWQQYLGYDKDDEIKTIQTHEQYAQNCYRIGD